MTNETLKKAIELNKQLKGLEEIKVNILEGAKGHWWSITDAGADGVFIPDALRMPFDKLVRELILKTKEEIKNL